MLIAGDRGTAAVTNGEGVEEVERKPRPRVVHQRGPLGHAIVLTLDDLNGAATAVGVWATPRRSMSRFPGMSAEYEQIFANWCIFGANATDLMRGGCASLALR